MLKDFLQRDITIERDFNVIYDGDVSLDLDVEQIEESAFLSFKVVSDDLPLDFTIIGLNALGSTITETISVDTLLGNRGFEEFSSLSSVGSCGVLTGRVCVYPINESGEPIFLRRTVGIFKGDRSYKPLNQTSEVFGQKQNPPVNYRFYFETSTDVKRNDLLTDGVKRFKVESVDILRSFSGAGSHYEATVSEIESLLPEELTSAEKALL